MGLYQGLPWHDLIAECGNPVSDGRLLLEIFQLLRLVAFFVFPHTQGLVCHLVFQHPIDHTGNGVGGGDRRLS